MTAQVTAFSFLSAAGGTVFVYAMWRMLNRYLPWFYGASFSDVMWGLDESTGFGALLLRFLPPVLGGALVAGLSAAIPWDVAVVSGAQAGLLAVWPNVVRPDNLPWRLQIRRRAVFVLYSLFVLACGIASLIGWAIVRLAQDSSVLHLSGFGSALLVELIIVTVLAAVRNAWDTKVDLERTRQREEEYEPGKDV